MIESCVFVSLSLSIYPTAHVLCPSPLSSHPPTHPTQSPPHQAYTTLLAAQIPAEDEKAAEVSTKGASFGTNLVNERADDGFDTVLPPFRGSEDAGEWGGWSGWVGGWFGEASFFLLMAP